MLEQAYTHLTNAIYEIALEYEFTGRWDETIRLLEIGIETEPDAYRRAKLQMVLGGLIWKRGELDRAAQLLETAQDYAGDDQQLWGDVLYHLGEVAYIRQQPNALATHEQALAIREKIGDQRGIAHSLSRIGVIYERRGEVDKALECYQRAVDICQAIQYKRAITRPYTHIGVYHERNGNLEQAFKYYQKALRINEEIGNVENLIFALCNVGEILYALNGDFEATFSHYKKALQLAKSLDYKLAIARTLWLMGNLYTEKDEFESALTAFDEMWTTAQAGHLEWFAMMANQNRQAMVVRAARRYRHDGHWTKAIQLLEGALERNPNAAILKVILSEFLLKQAQYERAEKLLQAALAQENDKATLAEALFNMGELYYFRQMMQQRGDYHIALDYYQKALAIREEVGDQEAVVDTLSRIGIIYEKFEDFETALGYHQKAITLAEKIGDQLGIKRPATHIGSYHQRNGDLEKALEYYQRSFAISQAAGEADGIMFGRANVGQALYKLHGDVDGALDHLHGALAIAQKLDHKLAICVCLLRLAAIYKETQQPDKAKKYYLQLYQVAKPLDFALFADIASKNLV